MPTKTNKQFHEYQNKSMKNYKTKGRNDASKAKTQSKSKAREEGV